MLAYADAYRRMERLRQSRKLTAAGAVVDDSDLPAPELNLLRPTLRVQHYMRKLGMYLMAEGRQRQRFEGAAARIQRAWRQHKDQRRMQDFAGMVRSRLLAVWRRAAVQHSLLLGHLPEHSARQSQQLPTSCMSGHKCTSLAACWTGAAHAMGLGTVYIRIQRQRSNTCRSSGLQSASSSSPTASARMRRQCSCC